jgi:WD40 repeat protein
MVAALAVSGDGSLLASGGWDTTIRLWNADDGLPVRVLSGHSNRVSAVAFSPDGTLLVSGSDDRTLKLWRVASGTLITNITGNARSSGSRNSVVFSPDGTLVAASLGTTNGVGIWRATNGSRAATLLGGASGTEWIAFSPDGALLAAAGGLRGSDTTIKIWRVSDGILLKVLPTSNEYGVGQLAFSPDGHLLVSGTDHYSHFTGSMELWQVGDWKRLYAFPSKGENLAFSPDGRLVVAGRIDATQSPKSVDVWRVSDGKLLLTMKNVAPSNGIFLPLVFAPDASRIFLGGSTSSNTVNGTVTQGFVSAVSAPTLLSSIVAGAGQITIELSGGSGRYQIQRSMNLTGDWMNVGDPVSARQISVPASDPRAFFRALEIPE